MALTYFPLHGIELDADGQVACTCREKAECPRIGKHPAWKWGELEAGQQVPNGRTGAGYGLVTGVRSGVFVVDTDGPDADARFRALGPLPETYTVRTPSGGRHYWFTQPAFPVRTSAGELGQTPEEKAATPKVSSKIDVRGEGGFAVLPGSPHKSGLTYDVEHNVPVAPAPAWLLEWSGLQGRLIDGDADGSYRPFPVDLNTDVGKKRLELGREACATMPPATATSTNARWNLALHLVRTLELPVDVAHGLITQHYLPRCDTKWTDREILHKLEDARYRSDMFCGDVTPMHPETWAARLHEDQRQKAAAKTGRRVHNPAHQYSVQVGQASLFDKPRKTTLNEVAADLWQHDDWDGVFSFDKLRDEIIAVNPPTPLDAEKDGLTAEDADRIGNWFAIQKGTSVPQDMAYRAATIVAKRRAFNPIEEYLQTCATRTGAIDELATRALGLTDDLDRLYVRKFLIAAVRRALVPGTKVDNVLTLQGPKGYRKSTFVTALFGDAWSSDSVGSIENEKEVGEKLAGKWGVELGELKSLRGAGPETVLQFLTRRTDRFRGAYARGNAKDKPRTCVFVGTTNDEEILRSTTGAEHRRFWIVAVDQKIDIDWITANRDAVWGEALALAQAGEPHWLDEHTETVHIERARQWEETDEWDDAIETYCKGRERVLVSDVWKHLGGASLEKLDHKTKIRIGKVLTRIGCTRKSKGDVRARFWIVPDDVRLATLPPEEAARRASQEVANTFLKNN